MLIFSNEVLFNGQQGFFHGFIYVGIPYSLYYFFDPALIGLDERMNKCVVFFDEAPAAELQVIIKYDRLYPCDEVSQHFNVVVHQGHISIVSDVVGENSCKLLSIVADVIVLNLLLNQLVILPWTHPRKVIFNQRHLFACRCVPLLHCLYRLRNTQIKRKHLLILLD